MDSNNYRNKSKDELLSSLPDKTYFYKVFKRQKYYLFFGILASICVALLSYIVVKDKYASKVHAVYDRTDTSSMSSNFNSMLKYQTLGSLFLIKAQSPAFLARVGKLSGGMSIMEGTTEKNIFGNMKKFLKKIKRKIIPSKLTEEQEMEVLSEFLKTNVIPDADPNSGIMGITVYGTTPENTQNIAAQAMELFIREILSEDVNSLDLKIDFLRQKIMGLKSDTNDKEKPVSNDKKPVNSKLTPEEIFRLNQQEAILDEQIRSKRNELDRITTDNSTRRISLETELNRMKTMLQPNHPTVKAKEEELRQLLSSTDSTKRLTSEIQELKRDLWRIKAKKIGSSENFNSFINNSISSYDATPEGSFLISLTEKIQDLHSERSDLFRQIETPELRTRLKVVSPASYEPKPNSPKKIITLIGILIVGIGASFFHIIFREFYCKLARDDWRVQRATGRAVLSQISSICLDKFPRVSPKLADALRGKLSFQKKPSLGARTLLSYRQIELALRRNSLGKINFFISPGLEDNTSNFFYNLLNIYSTDFSESCLIIDCNISDPIVQVNSSEVEQFWTENTVNQPLVVYGDNDKAFDLIPPPQRFSGKNSRAFNKENLKKIIGNLETNYTRIFIRSFPESFFVENQALAEVSSDCFICTDAKSTTFFEMERCLAQLDTQNVRGVILIGT